MYTELVIGLKDLTILKTIWITIAIIMGIITVPLICYVFGKIGECDPIKEIILTAVIAITCTLITVISIVKAVHYSYEKDYFIPIQIAPYVDEYLKENPETIFNPNNTLTSIDDLVESITTIIHKSVNLIPGDNIKNKK